MIYFNNDYSEGGHPKVLDALIRTNLQQPGRRNQEALRP